MASRTRPADLLRQLDPDSAADADLLGRFAAARDQAAFAELVRRHGPLVLGVLRRVVGHPDDADDAFQAVFLTLARKAGAVGRPDLLGNWLYGVAVRVGRRARRGAVRRRRREVPAVNAPEPTTTDVTRFDAGPELYEELDRLPAWYRDAVLLCDLQGLSRAEGARRLGIPEGTLSSRLAGGRKRLVDALTRRGVALTAALVPTALGAGQGTAAVSDDLITTTCGLVADWAAGAAVPVPVARLADGGFSMTKLLAAGTVGLALASAGLMAAGRPDEKANPADSPKVAEKSPAKAEPKGDGKGVSFTDRPRLRRAIDLDVPGVDDIIWSPDGEWIALSGPDKLPPPPPVPPGGGFGGGGAGGLGIDGGAGPPGVTLVRPDGPRDLKGFRQNFDPANSLQFVGFTPDGTQLVSVRREYELLSGRHEMWFWGSPANTGQPFGGINKRIVDLDPDRTTGYIFAPDLSSYRTVHVGKGGKDVSAVEVWEVSLKTGRRVRTLLKLEGDADWPGMLEQEPSRLTYTRVALSPDGRRLAVYRRSGLLTVYDPTSGRELWKNQLLRAAADNANGGFPEAVAFSPDAKRLCVVLPDGRPTVTDADTGAPVSALEGGRLSTANQEPIYPTFSGDGRLLAAFAVRLKPDPVNPMAPPEPNDQVVAVWDAATGKVLRSWPILPGPPIRLRFHPKLPVLAVTEQRGEKVRLGLWDFAAEVSDGK